MKEGKGPLEENTVWRLLVQIIIAVGEIALRTYPLSIIPEMPRHSPPSQHL